MTWPWASASVYGYPQWKQTSGKRFSHDLPAIESTVRNRCSTVVAPVLGQEVIARAEAPSTIIPFRPLTLEETLSIAGFVKRQRREQRRARRAARSSAWLESLYALEDPRALLLEARGRTRWLGFRSAVCSRI